MKTRHWNWIQSFALAALLPLFAACNSEGDELLQSEEKQPVQVNITRAATDENDWAWQNNDQIKMSITPYGGTATEYTLTYGSNTWSPSPEIGTITLPATAEAWWPSTASASKFSFQHNNQVETINNTGISIWLDGTVDQSSIDKLAQNDWMTSGQITIGGSSIDLTLQHRLAKVTVIITSSETINEVRFFSYTPNYPTGASRVDSYLAVNPLVTNNAYTAIVSAYNYNDDIGYLPFMRVKVGEDNTEKWVYLPRNLGVEGSLSAGNAYTFNLTVNNTSTRSADTSDCELELVEVRDMNEE